MDVYVPENDVEKELIAKAAKAHIPLSGGLELLPLCNMNCKMCYVRLSKKEMDEQGKLLNYSEWLKIVDEAIKQGLLFLLLTGGEPLLYPEFKELYQELSRRGLVLTVNTNGTLIDETWAEFFRKYGCRRINITLYGKDDETYEKLCNNPKGFSQVMNAARYLKEKKVPFRFTCSVTPDNVEQLPDLQKIADEMGVPLAVASYMFPGVRKNITASEQVRLSPQEAALVTLKAYQYQYPQNKMEDAARVSIFRLYKKPKFSAKKGFVCKGGKSSFWLNWKGELLPCGMFTEHKVDLKVTKFKDAWEDIVCWTDAIKPASKCMDCSLQNICMVCPAACHTETEKIEGCPSYLCSMSEEMTRLLLEYLPNEEREMHQENIERK